MTVLVGWGGHHLAHDDFLTSIVKAFRKQWLYEAEAVIKSSV